MSKRSKGKRKPNIRDISRHWPTGEEIGAVFDHLDTGQHSIVVAILGAAMLEYDLERLLRPRFRRKDDTTWGRLTGENGAASSFAQKINLAYAFGLIDEKHRLCLLAVKNVRNVFAHSKKLVDFDNDLVLEELNDVALPLPRKNIIYKKMLKPNAESPVHAGKASFIFLCFVLSNYLTKKDTKRLQARTRYYKKKTRHLSNALNLAFQEASGLGALGLYGGMHGVDPKAPNQLKGALTLNQLLADRDRNEGK